MHIIWLVQGISFKIHSDAVLKCVLATYLLQAGKMQKTSMDASLLAASKNACAWLASTVGLNRKIKE